MRAHGDEQRASTPGEPGAPGVEETAGHHRRTDADTDDEVSNDAEDEVSAATVEQDIEEALAVARRERDEYLDMVRRVQADFENYKKRMLRQQTDLLERASEGLVGRLLPVLDAFELAQAHLGQEDSPEGKALVQAANLLGDALAKEGLERIEADGAPFDPTAHEAVEHETAAASASDASEGAVSESDASGGPVVSGVLRAGYRYKGKVLRPAMVRVRG
ncbi:MAG TPA: nucleotide exchange factor GrpE [Acidimicrobiales bacterium]|nr:nucleotide exchange factor GrpE [Acidimicrobiales bacterium]